MNGKQGMGGGARRLKTTVGLASAPQTEGTDLINPAPRNGRPCGQIGLSALDLCGVSYSAAGCIT